MKLAIIADDLTGASDSGVQFARCGLHVSVMLGPLSGAGPKPPQGDVLVLDTDSRSASAESAYHRVAEASRYAALSGAQAMFKKMDSTLRGNLGAELDAVYDTLHPDFIVIAPAYPEAGRLVRDGFLYVHGTPVHETEFGRDPKTPVLTSFIPDLIGRQSKRSVEVISSSQLGEEESAFKKMLHSCRVRGVPYLVADSADSLELGRMLSLFAATEYSVVWAGSAGLARAVQEHSFIGENNRPQEIPPVELPVLAVVGSVSPRSRLQLERLLAVPQVKGIQLEGRRLVSGRSEREREILQAASQAEQSLHGGCHTVLYSSGDREAIEEACEAGKRYGMNRQEVSDAIAQGLGECAARLLPKAPVGGFIITGGDTAKQVCLALGATGIQLAGEVETGVPMGLLVMEEPLPVVTKAGGFGTDDVLEKALHVLTKGGGRTK
ncbi:four-carbon acid sugar kinase family protein [Paenibacillus sp. y28]|uniref:four-carbon acid sugar kinase family protein n=1 Tax=Paenibacillus sp. y28 TaxID=3129110 RepID=UPI003017B580